MKRNAPEQLSFDPLAPRLEIVRGQRMIDRLRELQALGDWVHRMKVLDNAEYELQILPGMYRKLFQADNPCTVRNNPAECNEAFGRIPDTSHTHQPQLDL